MPTKTCESCGERPTKSPKSRFCDDTACLRERRRKWKADHDRRKRETTLAEPTEEWSTGGVFAATLFELQASGRVDTAAGQSALALASRIDHGAKDSGSSIAALSRQHLAALGEALKDVTTEANPLDELRARREARSA